MRHCDQELNRIRKKIFDINWLISYSKMNFGG